jgi:transcriptional antiterminator RfaH
VVQTHPHAEAKAAAHLEHQGYSVYLPRYLKRRRHARRIEIVPAPLFPSYLFVVIDMFSRRWRAIRSRCRGWCAAVKNPRYCWLPLSKPP